MRNTAIFALAMAIAGAAGAQDAQRPDPKDPKAPIPAVPYRSAFDGYRAYAEPFLAPWREVNERVGEERAQEGHSMPQEPQGAAKAPGNPPAQSGHEGHK